MGRTVRRPGGRSGGLAFLLAAIAASGCASVGDSPVEPVLCSKPALVREAVAPNPQNVLSALVSAIVLNADSVVIAFGTGAALDSATPATLVRGDSVAAPVLGLRPETEYRAQVIAFNQCGTTSGAVLQLVTGPLPSDIPSYKTEGRAPAPGYIVFAAGNYGLAIDNEGRVVWYHHLPAGIGLNFQPQPNGRYVARPPIEAGSTATWVEITPDSRVTRSLACAGGLHSRMHDMIALPDGSYWLLCDEVRTLDLSAQNGSATASVLGTAVQKRGAAGEILFEWSPFDHLAVELSALEPGDLATTPINWTHGNALDLDTDGNVLVSFRNLSEVVKIDTRTGRLVWRLGGARNQFAFDNVEAPPFARQHGLRAVGSSQILLLDNLGNQGASRVERYQLDEVNRRARLVASYTSPDRLIAPLGGNVQAIVGGHTLVSFGNGGGVEEYDSAGNLVWRISGNTGYIFRAQRIRSLYQPALGDHR